MFSSVKSLILHLPVESRNCIRQVDQAGMISKDFVISKKSINFASHLTGSRPVKNFFNKLTAVFKEMKKDIHPKEYREVVFKDMSNDETFITRSTVASRETIEIDGKEYPLVKLEITSSSHPFFTGKQKLVDTAGRVDKFRSRYGNRSKK